MNASDKLRNIVREAMRAFIEETGLTPSSLEFSYLKLKMAAGAIPPKNSVGNIDIEIIFGKGQT